MKLALVLCGSLIAGAAVAAPKWDANGDGTVSTEEKAQHRAEMKAKRMEMRQQMLQKFDANRNGTLDDAERTVMRDEMATRAFQRLDKDGNGAITIDEFKQAKGKRFFKGHRGGHFKRGLKAQ
jgi:hypothetical protein